MREKLRGGKGAAAEEGEALRRWERGKGSLRSGAREKGCAGEGRTIGLAKIKIRRIIPVAKLFFLYNCF